MSYLSDQLSDQSLAKISSENVSLEKRIDSMIWFLNNLHITNDTSVKEALAEFCNFCASLDEQFNFFEEKWISVLNGLLLMFRQQRPDIQALILRVILELCRKESNIQV